MTRRTLISWNPAPGGGYRYTNHFVGILSPMDCRGFRSKHVAFVDDFLSGEEVVAMQRHLLECEQCAAHDAKVRRALLVFRNLPTVEPSSDFYTRLRARIESERTAAFARPTIAARGPGIGTFMAGKSTILRQIGLIVLIAQMGSFVPAAHARIGIVDRVFTRVGASDNLVRGQSTFMTRR